MGVLENYLYALKTNMFHSIFNAWMSALSIMTVVCFSGIFGVRIVNLNDFIFNVVMIPTLVTSIAALCDIVFIFLAANRKVYSIFKNYEKTPDYNVLIKQFNRAFKLYCIVGVLLYLVFAYVICYIAKYSFLSNNIYNFDVFKCSVMGGSFLFGVIWNLSSVCRLKRIEYNELLGLDNKINIEIGKFRSYVYQLIFEIIGCSLTVCSILVYYNQNNYTELNASYYSYYYIVYFSLICLYLKKVYAWEFSYNNQNSILYPTRNIFK